MASDVSRLWLLELSQGLPSDAQLVGYDVSSAQFPNRESLPPQVRLENLDILSDELPEELVGTFDVVHVRALVLVVQAGDPRTLLSNSCALLSMSRERSLFRLQSATAMINGSLPAQSAWLSLHNRRVLHFFSSYFILD